MYEIKTRRLNLRWMEYIHIFLVHNFVIIYKRFCSQGTGEKTGRERREPLPTHRLLAESPLYKLSNPRPQIIKNTIALDSSEIEKNFFFIILYIYREREKEIWTIYYYCRKLNGRKECEKERSSSDY